MAILRPGKHILIYGRDLAINTTDCEGAMFTLKMGKLLWLAYWLVAMLAVLVY